MKFATKISRVDNDDLEKEYLEILKTKGLEVYICPNCITKVMSLGKKSPTEKTISAGLDAVMLSDFPRECPHCHNFLLNPWEVDLSGITAFENGHGVN